MILGGLRLTFFKLCGVTSKKRKDCGWYRSEFWEADKVDQEINFRTRSILSVNICLSVCAWVCTSMYVVYAGIYGGVCIESVYIVYMCVFVYSVHLSVK